MKLSFVILLLVVSLFLTGCGTSGPTPPDPTTYTIGGTVTGLTGTGLVLQNSGGNNLTVSAKATSFAFPTAVASGSPYKVTVLTQPSSPTQSCVVTGGSGTATANVTSVSVTCTTTTYTIGGSVSNLVGTGLVLQDNGGNNLTVPAGANTFSFPTALDAGASYAVSVLTQPSVPTQNCVVTGGSGTAAGNVATVSIACTTLTYTVSGTISGLVGTGLVLQNNGSSLPVAAGATGFGFTAGVGEGLPYAVTVSAQPSNPVQSCAVVANGSGTSSVNVTTVAITCTTTLYTIGATVSGLTGTGLVLQDNGGDNLAVTANGTFDFATKLNSASAYNVTVLTQPSGLAQNCVVTDGGGTANASVDVVVACANINEWTWEDGPDTDDQFGVYGTMGTAATTNVPGARYSGASWSDKSGNFWLFGGLGYESPTNGADFNDLWEGNYNSSGQWQWNWVAGADVAGVGGTYGTLGTPASGNIPGGRDSAVSWTDASGNFWLFGGHGYDSTDTSDNLNDLWEYATTGPNAGKWTWVSGSDTVDQLGNYGTLGTGTTTTVPGARYAAVSWIDQKGNFWLFGGRYDVGTGANLVSYYLNDLWEGNYDSSNQWIWTWMGGSQTTNVDGVYGSLGMGTASNCPGSRFLSVSWTDTLGNLWLFGGYGYDSVSAPGRTADLSDLWEYNITTGIWAWVGGPERASMPGTYGNLGIAASSNIPGSREGAVAWADSLGNFWLFGGVGIDSTNTAGELDDLWQYNLTTGDWTWVNGPDVINQPGNWGTLGVAATTNVPGARGVSSSWIDSSGNLWLFGGNGPLSGVNGSFSDLWKYVP